LAIRRRAITPRYALLLPSNQFGFEPTLATDAKLYWLGETSALDEFVDLRSS